MLAARKKVSEEFGEKHMDDRLIEFQNWNMQDYEAGIPSKLRGSQEMIEVNPIKADISEL